MSIGSKTRGDRGPPKKKGDLPPRETAVQERQTTRREATGDEERRSPTQQAPSSDQPPYGEGVTQNE